LAKKHMFLMLACCLIPLTGLVAIYLLKLPLNSVFTFGMILLCPLLHFVMMRGMMTGHNHQQADHSHHMSGREHAPMAQKAQWNTGENEELS